MPVPSVVEAPLPATAPTHGVSAVLDRLSAAGLPLADLGPAAPSVEGADWQVDAVWDDGELRLPLRIYSVESDHHFVDVHLTLGNLDEEEAAALQDCARAVGVEADFDVDRPLDSFHAQLRVLDALAPETLGLVDRSACVVRKAGWLADAARAGVPPHPNTLYTIHQVVPESDTAPCWLHTHGLHRCGVIELDILDAPRDEAGLMGQLLNTTAGMLLDRGVPDPDDPFVVGLDMELAWLDPATALRKLPRPRGGGGREDRDDIHSDDRGVLVVKQKGMLWGFRYRSPAIFLPTLQNHPILYVSDLETSRRTALAHERLGLYLDLFARFADEEFAVFLVKLGLDTPSGVREHPWFELHGVDGDAFDATCTNEPRDIPDLAQGQRGRFPIAAMSDFTLLGPFGQVGPDGLPRLARELDDPAFVARLRAVVKEG